MATEFPFYFSYCVHNRKTVRTPVIYKEETFFRVFTGANGRFDCLIHCLNISDTVTLPLTPVVKFKSVYRYICVPGKGHAKPRGPAEGSDQAAPTFQSKHQLRNLLYLGVQLLENIKAGVCMLHCKNNNYLRFYPNLIMAQFLK